MAHRRTKKQKSQANHQAALYTYTASAEVGAAPQTATKKNVEAGALYDYDTSLIKQDLIKTVIIASIIITIELGLYYYLR